MDWKQVLVDSGLLAFIQSCGIILSSAFLILAYRRDFRARKVTTLLEINKSYREVWGRVFNNPALARVLEDNAENPNELERLFVLQIILHARAAFEAQQRGLVDIEHFNTDMAMLFLKPIPRAVWQDVKGFQSDEFRSLIDDAVAHAERALTRTRANTQAITQEHDGNQQISTEHG